MLRAEEIEARSSVDFLRTHILQLWGDELDKKTVDEKLLESIAFWRVKNSGATLPYLGDIEHKDILKEIGEIFYSQTLGDRSKQLMEYVDSLDLEAIRLTTNNKGKYYLYYVIPEEERFYYGKSDIYPFVYKTPILEQKRGFKIDIKKRKIIPFKHSPLNEQLFKEYQEYKIDKTDEKIPDNFISKLEKLKQIIKTSKDLYEKIRNGEDHSELIARVVEDRRYRNVMDRSGYVLSATISFPIGLYLHQSVGEDKYYGEFRGKTLYIVEASIDVSALAARYGNDEISALSRKWTSDTYKNPISHLRAIDSVEASGKEVFFKNEVGFAIGYKNIVVKKLENEGYHFADNAYNGHAYVPENEDDRVLKTDIEVLTRHQSVNREYVIYDIINEKQYFITTKTK